MSKTVSCFTSIIYLENVYGINRSFLLPGRRHRIFGNTISIISVSALIAAGIYNLNYEIELNEIIFQGLLALEFLIFLVAVRYRDVAFTYLSRLDEKCGVDDTYLIALQNIVRKETFVCVLSNCLDILFMFNVSDIKLSKMFVYLILYSTHDAETVVFALIIRSLNLRLAMLRDALPIAGSRVYRHVLIASSHISEEFTPRIIMIMISILFTTVSYSCAVILLSYKLETKKALFVFWREIRTMYCMWRLCSASSESEAICQRLGYQLATKMAFDPAFDKAKNPQAFATVGRWYTSILDNRPRYMRGTICSLGLSIPLHLLDLSVNYVLIIIQIYVAY